jgi:hypothetical protein
MRGDPALDHCPPDHHNTAVTAAHASQPAVTAAGAAAAAPAAAQAGKAASGAPHEGPAQGVTYSLFAFPAEDNFAGEGAEAVANVVWCGGMGCGVVGCGTLTATREVSRAEPPAPSCLSLVPVPRCRPPARRLTAAAALASFPFPQASSTP